MNKRLIFLSILSLLIIPSVIAAISVEKIDKGSVVIAELDNPAVFDFIITNNGQADSVEIFSLLGVSFSPRGTFEIQTGKTTIEVKAYPNKAIRKIPGPYIFEYQIKGRESFKDTLTITIAKLEDTITIEGSNFKPGDTMVNVTFANVQNTYINNMKVSLRSEFFDESRIISFKPYESQTFSIPINMEKARKLNAGRYILSASVTLEDANARIEGILNYLEQQGTSISTISDGIIVKQTTIKKTNEGNTQLTDTITTKRDVLTRLFTSYSREPLSEKRSGLIVEYQWEENLTPGESWFVTTTTNYTLPFILLLLIVVVGLLVSRYSRTHVKVIKEVSYVKTRGGQFALKVRVSIKARSHVDSVQLVDRLPGMTKLYEKFGTKPDKFDSSTRRLFWNIDRLEAGEERVFSYIVYSTIDILGRYELPPAVAVFEKGGDTHEIISNRAFFVSDSVGKSQE
ncbi:hypothetical protein J4461_04485 [Candidatus Pacearchaeota archaeon]|nr:hypothetical protein [Candidatus Pacearchaeota archaeon]